MGLYGTLLTIFGSATLDLNAAAMFVATVRAGSLSGAATALSLPLATLSRRIGRLEASLRVQLLERSTRGVTLTEAGARLYEQAVRGIELLAQAEEAVVTGQAELRGRLRVSLPPNFEPWWVIMRGFQRTYPEIRLSVYVTERRVNLVEDGVDVALRIGPVDEESVVARRLIRFRHVMVAAPSLVRRLGTPVTPADLPGFPCGVWAGHLNGRAKWVLGASSIVLEPVLSTNDYGHLRHCAEAGQVITELPEFLALPGLRKGSLQRVLEDVLFPEMELHLIFLSHRHPSRIVRAYLDYCSSVVTTGGLMSGEHS